MADLMSVANAALVVITTHSLAIFHLGVEELIKFVLGALMDILLSLFEIVRIIMLAVQSSI